MSQFKSVFGDFNAFALDRHRSSLAKSVEFGATRMDSASAGEVMAPQYGLQEKLRPLFGKHGRRAPAYGDHPEYEHLRGTDRQASGYVVSLFMDIEGSTRLGLLYPTQKVVAIKQNILRAAIETIQALDGHVHRMMGDAVLAFFRSKSKEPEDSAIDALNCATVLVSFFKEVVIPQLGEHGVDHDFGIRVGIDYGDAESVLWSSFGYPGMEEVTATSFFVDTAAKLQQASPRNGIMIGQSVRELLDFPSELWSTKLVTRDGEKVPSPYLLPNYSDAGGARSNYRQFLVRHADYLSLLPANDVDQRPFKVSAVIKDARGMSSTDVLQSAARSCQRNRGIEFKVVAIAQIPVNCFVRFSVENHGAEARDLGGENRGDHITEVPFCPATNGSAIARRWEATAYKGLHYMRVLVHREGEPLIPEKVFGVYVR
jgi:adenylate cyclase